MRRPRAGSKSAPREKESRKIEARAGQKPFTPLRKRLVLQCNIEEDVKKSIFGQAGVTCPGWTRKREAGPIPSNKAASVAVIHT